MASTAAPIVATSSGTVSAQEQIATVVDNGLTLTDADSTTLASATVAITGNFASGQDFLAFTNGDAATYGNIAATYTTTTGVLTLTSDGATATIAQFEAALRAVTYIDTSDTPSTAARTITFTASDGVNGSAAATRDLSVTAVNDPLTLGGTGAPVNYTENGPGTVIAAGLTVTDPDTANLTGSTVQIGGFVAGDRLNFTNQNGITGSYNLGTGVLTLSGSASLAAYQAAFRSIQFTSTSQNPGNGDRGISFTATDGGGTFSTVTQTVRVTPVNDAPVLAGAGNTTTYTEGAPGTAIAPALTLSDADNATLTGATVTISSGRVSGDMLSYTAQNGISGVFEGSTGRLTLSGSATVAAYETALRSVAFASTSNNPGNGSRTISFTATDGTDASAVVTSSVAVTPVNDAPTANPDFRFVSEDRTIATNDRAVGFLSNDSDPDNGDAALLTIQSVQASGGGVATVPSSGTTAVIGTYGTLNLAADGTYSYAANSNAAQALAENANATDIFTYTARDPAGATSSTTLTISITGANDAPVIDLNGVGAGINNTSAYTENGSRATLANGLTVTDVDTGARIAGAVVSIGAGFLTGQDRLTVGGATSGTVGAIGYSYDATTGQLTLTTQSGQSATQAQYQSVLGQVQFDSSSNAPGTSRQISWLVNDGITNSGIASTALTVTPTNDAPLANPDTASVNEGQTISRSTRETGVLSNDVDPDTGDSTGIRVGYAVAGSLDGSPTGAVLVSAAGTPITGTYGTLTLATNGTYSYTADSVAARSLAAGQVVTDSFGYQAYDSEGGATTTTLVVTITGADYAPVAVPDTSTSPGAQSAIEAGGVTNGTPGRSGSGNVLANDTDIDAGDTRTVVGVIAGTSTAVLNSNVGTGVSGQYGTVTVGLNGAYSYVVDNANATVDALAAGASLTDTFSYTVQDATGLTATTTLTVTVAGANDTPIIGGDSAIALAQGGTVVLTTDDLTASDVDVGQSLTYTVTGTTRGQVIVDGTVLPANGTFTPTQLAAGLVSFRQDGSADRRASFNVTVSDGTAVSSPATILASVTLAPLPDPEPPGPTAGNDSLVGTAGPDTISLGLGNDTSTGGAGSDLIYGNQGDDLIYGNQDADLIYGGQGEDRAYGGQGDDRLFGNAGNDVLSGNTGNDIVYGNQGADIVYGNQGSDVLFGGQGDDILYGGQGDDILIGGLGNNTLVGGVGADRYTFGANPGGRDLILGFNQDEGDRMALGGQTYTVSSAQNGDALLTLSGGGVVDLAGVRADQVDASYFAA